MPQVINPKTGDVIHVTGMVRECPDCGTLVEETVCEICGWVEGTIRDEVQERTREVKAKPFKPTEDHIDASNELVCDACGGNKDEIGGVLQCALCGPIETEPEPAPEKPRVLPNIEDVLPKDPRCPKCVERAEAMAAEGNFEPHPIGEREMLVDYLTGAVSLHCPECDAEEEIWDAKKQTAAAVAKEPVPEAVSTHDGPTGTSGQALSDGMVASIAEWAESMKGVDPSAVPSPTGPAIAEEPKAESAVPPPKRGRGRPRKVV